MDVLLADIAMPEEDGYALIRQVRASPAGRIATIPAAAVTAHARDDERRRGAGGRISPPSRQAVRTRSADAHGPGVSTREFFGALN